MDEDKYEDWMSTRMRTNMRMDMRRTLKQTQRLKGRVTRTISQDRMRTNMKMYEDGLKNNLKADAETEGKGDKDDDPGHGCQKPATDTNPVLSIVR